MAEDKIFFDEQALSVVDSWLSGTNDKKDKSSSKAVSSSTGAPVSKSGLGFKGKVPEAKVKDALQVRLEKSKKRKNEANTELNKSKQEDNDNDDDDDDDDSSGHQMHGIVEDMPVSRTQRNSKPVVIAKSQPKKKVAAELINGNLVYQKEEITVPVEKSPVPNATAPGNAKAFGSEAPSGGEEYKRKRTKTRSKQKNIRRDNRPDSQKPSYITDTQAEDYRGRDLTEVTYCAVLCFAVQCCPVLCCAVLLLSSVKLWMVHYITSCSFDGHYICCHLFDGYYILYLMVLAAWIRLFILELIHASGSNLRKGSMYLMETNAVNPNTVHVLCSRVKNTVVIMQLFILTF
jgi:hypothetical protein